MHLIADFKAGEGRRSLSEVAETVDVILLKESSPREGMVVAIGAKLTN
jgi:hypothetical protein